MRVVFMGTPDIAAACLKKIIADGFEINIDIRSVNHRYLDLNLRIPKYYSFLEDKIRTAVGKYISRGKIELNIYMLVVVFKAPLII